MSRVFVSCSQRDRAVGTRVENIVRTLGHQPLDDHDEVRGTLWWNEVVGRIESSDVFVALVSPSYAEAQSCRLAAKHAAASGLPVVRLDLGGDVTGCHPVVEEAERVPFDPDHPAAVDKVADALGGTTPPPGEDDESTAVERPAAESADSESGDSEPADSEPADSEPGAGERGESRRLEVGIAVVVVLVAAVVFFVSMRDGGGDQGPLPRPHGLASEVPSAAPSVEPSEEVAGPEAELLALVGTARTDLLRPSSCGAGQGKVVCRDPASGIRDAVLESFPTRQALYDAYDDAVQQLSGDPVPENTGDCTGKLPEGEVSWNLDREHRDDITVAEQVLGGLDPASEAAGRVFCTETSDVVQLVWTQDPGLLGTVTGQPATITIAWWNEVHLRLACAAGGSGSGCEEEE
jgi:hypothetical protein